jgi:hypothetical protein
MKRREGVGRSSVGIGQIKRPDQRSVRASSQIAAFPVRRLGVAQV